MCLNYKFFLLLGLPFVGTILGIIMLVCDVNYLALFIELIAICGVIAITIIEPVYYIISENGIKICRCFQQHYFPWKEISCIKIYYDVSFRILFIKDYVIYTKTPQGIPKRHERIFKYSKTKKLIEKYGISKCR